MRMRTYVGVLAGLLICSSALAGIPRSRPVPALGEEGVIALAVALVGAGVAALRRRGRGKEPK